MWKTGTSGRLCMIALLVTNGGCDTGPAPQRGAAPAIGAQPWNEPRERSLRDAASGRVWVLREDALFAVDAGSGRPVEVNLPGWTWVDAQYACPPDIALGPAGEAIVTSNVVPTLWRVDPDTLAVSTHPLELDAAPGREFGFSAIAYSVLEESYLARSDVDGSLWRIDPALRGARRLGSATAGPDHCGSAAFPQVAQ